MRRCVSLISSAASHVPWLDQNLKNSPYIKLLSHPNTGQSGSEFIESIISDLILYGNSYIYAQINNSGTIESLLPISPQKVSLKIESGRLISYQIKQADGTNLEIRNNSKISRILHLKNYNPYNNFEGLSHLVSCSKSIDLHNSITDWNCSMIKNGARPSGALIIHPGNHSLTEEQYQRAKEEVAEVFSGAFNTGRPMVFEGDIKWQEMSLNPKDMDFLESKNLAAREIALAIGVPPPLLGIAGDNTYNNMQEARLALWEETIIPLLDKISGGFSNWLSHLSGHNVDLLFDLDQISALTERRQDIWSKLESASFMTINEKRAVVGLAPLAYGNSLSKEDL